MRLLFLRRRSAGPPLGVRLRSGLVRRCTGGSWWRPCGHLRGLCCLSLSLALALALALGWSCGNFVSVVDGLELDAGELLDQVDAGDAGDAKASGPG